MPQPSTPLDQALTLIKGYRSFTTALSNWSKPLGLSADGCLIVLLLSSEESPSHSELAASLGLNLATATKILDRLVSDNFVHRKAHATDRRRIQIHLTSDGVNLANEIRSEFAKFMDQFR